MYGVVRIDSRATFLDNNRPPCTGRRLVIYAWGLHQQEQSCNGLFGEIAAVLGVFAFNLMLRFTHRATSDFRSEFHIWNNRPTTFHGDVIPSPESVVKQVLLIFARYYMKYWGFQGIWEFVSP